MPQLSDLIKKRATKKFVKKPYRPWDLSGTGTVDHANETEVKKTHVDNEKPQLKTNQTKVNEIEVSEEKNRQPSNTIATDKPLSDKSHLTYNPDVIETIDNELDNKRVTIREQTDNALGNKQVTIRKQLDNAWITNRKQTGNDLDNITDNDIGNENTVTTITDTIRKLTGIQHKIFFYVLDLCTSRGQLDTGCILTNDLVSLVNSTIGSVETSLTRLTNKHLLIRKKGKTSRGGHLILGMTKIVHSTALQLQRLKYNPAAKYIDLDNALGNKLDNQLGNKAPYSSSNNINTTTTGLPNDWEQIDFSSLASIGFSRTQLVQLHSKQLNVPEAIQSSINHFAFGLMNNEKVKAYPNPLNVLMGVLRNGGIWTEQNYVSPKEKALAELLEAKKQEATKLEALERQLFEEEYRIWIMKLSESEKDKILQDLPPTLLMSKDLVNKTKDGFLLNYFKQKIYAKKY